MTPPVETVLQALRDCACEPKQNGNGWKAICPAHDDSNPSLSVSEGDDGRALVKCHAGCEYNDIVTALELQPRDLMPDNGPAKPTPARGKGPKQTHKPTGKRCQTLDDAFAALDRMMAKQKGRRVAEFPYVTADGSEVGFTVRYDLPTPKGQKQGKTFRVISFRDGGWYIRGMLKPWPLYRLPELAGAQRVYIVEGEKAADAARAIGLTATTSAHGSQSPESTDWTPLAGRECVILPDNDEAGNDFADAVAGILAKLTPDVTIRVVNLSGLPTKGDIADFVAIRHHEGQTVEAIRAEVEALADAADLVQLDDSPDDVPEDEWRPNLICMSDIEARPVDWLWPQRIPAGRISLLVGVPGAGKSFLTCDLAYRISTGTPWPDGSPCERGSVILITAEDDPHDTIRPRLDAHGANVSMIHLLSGVHRIADGKRQELMFTLADERTLEQSLEQHEDCRLVIIDPIGSFLGSRTDAHRDNEVRAVLSPVSKLAEKYGPAVLVVAHRRKSTGGTADDSALGSRAFTGIARAVWHLSRDQDDKERRLLLPGKCNLAVESTGLAFTIAGDPGAVQWEREPVTMTANEALSREAQNGRDSSALSEAKDWLLHALADGPRCSKELKDAAEAAGIAERTLQRAKTKLGIKASPNGFGGPWVWSLPAGPSNEQCRTVRQDIAESAKGNTLANTGETVADSGNGRLSNGQSNSPIPIESTGHCAQLKV